MFFQKNWQRLRWWFLTEEKFVRVTELVPNIRNINLLAKIIELGDTRFVTNRKTSEEHQVRDVLIGDESGVVFLSAWNEIIDQLKEGSTYELSNVKTILFRRRIRVSFGKKGLIKESDKQIDTVNMENNVSEKEQGFSPW